MAWLDRSRSIARSTALGVALSFFCGFVIVYHELKNDFMGRLELEFGGIECEFGGLNPLASTSVEKCHNFLITWSSGIDVFFLHISNPVSKNVKRYLKT